MKFIRIIALVLLALVYLGGTYAQVSGAAFPLVGTGEKAYGDFLVRITDRLTMRR